MKMHTLTVDSAIDVFAGGNQPLPLAGLPAGATATFTPSSVTHGGSTGTSTPTVRSAMTTAADQGSASLRFNVLRPLALVFFAVPRRVRKRWSRRVLLVLLMLVSLSAVAAMIGCSGHSSSRHPSTTYTNTVPLSTA